MTAQPTSSEAASAARGPADRVRAALEDEGQRLALCRAISAIVGSLMRGSAPGDGSSSGVAEVFGETSSFER